MGTTESADGEKAMLDRVSSDEGGAGDPNDLGMIEIPRAFVYACLFVTFFLAFIFVPYWESAGGWWQVSLVAGTTGLGVWWAIRSSGAARLRIARKDALWFLAVGAALAVINARALSYDIPCRGDENFHIPVTLRFAFFIIHHWAPSLALAVVMMIPFVGWQIGKLTWWFVAISVGLSLATAVGIGIEGGSVPSMARYPYLSKVFSAVPVMLAQPFWGVHPPEWVLRVVPFVAAVGVAWLPMRMVRDLPRWAHVMLALVIGTLPLILYYSSLLYLEMPAVFLMMIVCFRARDLFALPPVQLRREPSWYALLLIGFIKETAAPFLLVFLVIRYAVQFRRTLRVEGKWRAMLQEAEVGFCVVAPIAFYLVYRTLYASVRPFHPDLTHLLQWRAYGFGLKAYAIQFGPILVLSAAGFVLLLARRERVTILFLVAALVADNVFHLLDHVGYYGYSRYSLFAAPMLLVPACFALDWMAVRGRWVIGLVLVALLAGNFWLCPIESDGSRKRNWGDSTDSVTEWSYPFRNAIDFINTHYYGGRVAFPFKWNSSVIWYYAKHLVRYYEVTGDTRIRLFLEGPAPGKASTVVCDERDERLVQALEEQGYKPQATFGNEAGNRLVVLSIRENRQGK